MKKIPLAFITLGLLSSFIWYFSLSPLDLCGNHYTSHSAINMSGVNGGTISGDSINGGGVSTILIHLTNCSNIHITKCRLVNTTNTAIQLDNCYNITVDSCYESNIRDGLHANYCPLGGIKFNYNYVLNVNGPYPKGNACQFNHVNGGGNQINYNRVENISGVAQHPQDLLSVYISNGISGDSIQVIGNWIRGGQYLYDSGGAAGIVLGDVGGSYQVARGNYIINGGAVGMQVQGGHDIKMDHNFIYGSGPGFSYDGLAFANYSNAGCYNINISYNRINWKKSDGTILNKFFDQAITTSTSTSTGATGGAPLATPTGWSTNSPDHTADAGITTGMLPTNLITTCTVPIIIPNITYSGSPFTYTYGTRIANLTPLNIGGAAVSYSATLPAGLTINTTTGVISGIPVAVSGSTSYVVTATNSAGSDTGHITISVRKAPLVLQGQFYSIVRGYPTPTLGFTYSGFVNGDTSIDTTPSLSTTYTTSSPIGIYPVTLLGAESTKYSLTIFNGAINVYIGPVFYGVIFGGIK